VDACDEAVAVLGPTSATVQELHLVAVHLIAAAVDVTVRDALAMEVGRS